MTVQQTKLDSIKTQALAQFDDLTHMAFGTGTGAEDPSDTTLGTEVQRNAFDETSIKAIGAGTYDFSGLLGLTEANGSTITEIGTFDAASSGEMGTRDLISPTVAKTASIDLSAGVRVTVTVENG